MLVNIFLNFKKKCMCICCISFWELELGSLVQLDMKYVGAYSFFCLHFTVCIFITPDASAFHINLCTLISTQKRWKEERRENDQYQVVGEADNLFGGMQLQWLFLA